MFTRRAGTPSEVEFWRAIEMAAGSELPEDVADVARYVASRGDAAVASFAARLDRAVTRLREAGVPDVLRSGATGADGRAFADLTESETDRALEAMVLGGRRFFETVLADPRHVHAAEAVPSVDLGAAVETARAEPGIEEEPLWVERPGDRRRDGSPWIVIYLARGVGVDRSDTRPWNVPGFVSRFEKVALLRSLDDSWREWRDGIGAKRLDVWIEYSLPEDEPERVAVTDRGRTTGATVYRDAHRLQAAVEPVAIAQREAETVLDLVRGELGG